MSILQDVVNEGYAPYSSPEQQEPLLDALREGQSESQRRRLLAFADMTAAAAERAACDNYFRGFCSGLWFAEHFLRKMKRF